MINNISNSPSFGNWQNINLEPLPQELAKAPHVNYNGDQVSLSKEKSKKGTSFAGKIIRTGARIGALYIAAKKGMKINPKGASKFKQAIQSASTKYVKGIDKGVNFVKTQAIALKNKISGSK